MLHNTSPVIPTDTIIPATTAHDETRLRRAFLFHLLRRHDFARPSLTAAEPITAPAPPEVATFMQAPHRHIS